MKQKFYLAKLVLLFVFAFSAAISSFAVCDPVLSPAATAASATSVNISWAPPAGGAMMYQYVLSTSMTTPSGPGTPSMMTMETVSGLTPSTTYYLFVRNDCGGTYSTWSGPITVTTPAAASSCVAPAPAAMAVSCDTGAAMWSAVSGAMGYETAITTTSTPPSGSGTATTMTMCAYAGLSASTTYYIHVRTDCGMGSYSAWASASFATPACSPACLAPTGITKTPGANNVLLSWAVATGALGYEYKVSTTSTTPTSAGTPLTATSITVPGLTPGTAYYAFVRTKCGASTYSPWSSAQSFSTAATGVGTMPASAVAELLQVYPNPVAGNMTVAVRGVITDVSAITVSALDGRVVKCVHITNNNMSIDMSGLGDGLYFVKYTDGVNTQVVKIVKQ